VGSGVTMGVGSGAVLGVGFAGLSALRDGRGDEDTLVGCLGGLVSLQVRDVGNSVVTTRRRVRDETRWEGLLGCADSRKEGDILGSVAPRRRWISSRGGSSILDKGDDRAWNCIIDDDFIGCLGRRSMNGEVGEGVALRGKSKHSSSGHEEKVPGHQTYWEGGCRPQCPR
jgi:hypothetical protein